MRSTKIFRSPNFRPTGFYRQTTNQAPRLDTVRPFHVAAYIEQMPGSKPTIKQKLAAIRMLYDFLVIRQLVLVNPTASVRGPKYVFKRGKTPVWSREDTKKLLESIPRDDLAGLRDRALISTMLFSFARISAVLSLQRQDFYYQGARRWLRFHEKGGKDREMPAHHQIEETIGVDLEMKAKALALCDLPNDVATKPWHSDPGLIGFLRAL